MSGHFFYLYIYVLMKSGPKTGFSFFRSMATFCRNLLYHFDISKALLIWRKNFYQQNPPGTLKVVWILLNPTKFVQKNNFLTNVPKVHFSLFFHWQIFFLHKSKVDGLKKFVHWVAIFFWFNTHEGISFFSTVDGATSGTLISKSIFWANSVGSNSIQTTFKVPGGFCW